MTFNTSAEPTKQPGDKMKFLTTTLAVSALAGIMHLGPGSQALAQSYPSSPITLVVPFAAGSGTDAVARVIAQKLSDRLAQGFDIIVYH